MPVSANEWTPPRASSRNRLRAPPRTWPSRWPGWRPGRLGRRAENLRATRPRLHREPWVGGYPAGPPGARSSRPLRPRDPGTRHRRPAGLVPVRLTMRRRRASAAGLEPARRTAAGAWKPVPAVEHRSQRARSRDPGAGGLGATQPDLVSRATRAGRGPPPGTWVFRRSCHRTRARFRWHGTSGKVRRTRMLGTGRSSLEGRTALGYGASPLRHREACPVRPRHPRTRPPGSRCCVSAGSRRRLRAR